MKYLLLLLFCNFHLLATDPIHQILVSELSDSLKVDQLNALGTSDADFRLRNAALDSAFTLSHRAIYHYGKAQTYLSKAFLALDRDSAIKALDFFNLAIFGFQDLKLPKETAQAQYNLARTYQAIGELDRANQTYHQLLKTYEKVGTRVGHVFLQLANNYIELGKEDSAVVYSSRLPGSEVRPMKFSHTFSEDKKQAFKHALSMRDLQNELEKAKFRTDVIAFLLGILLFISFLIIIYLTLKVRKLNKSK
jgi:tetratricopeptide (TPR) repeat protein